MRDTAFARLCMTGLAAAAFAAIASAAGAQSAEPGKTRPGMLPAPKALERTDVQRQGFSIALLLGDMQGAESLDSVPAAARRALQDMKDFLPYKSYRLLDSQWTLCCGGATPSITRLRGTDDQEYELELRAQLVANEGPGKWVVRFVLREAGEVGPVSPKGAELDRNREMVNRGLIAPAALETRIADINREIFALERERAQLSAQATRLRSQSEVGIKDPFDAAQAEQQLAMVTKRITDLKKSLTTTSLKLEPRAVIDTSFRMDGGETVVVGTSGLKGGTKALIALLTAVGPRSKSD